MQALYAAIKFPMLILLTTAGNALINWLLAHLLDTGLSFRDTVGAILHGFALTAVVLAALAPVELFFASQLANPQSVDALRAHRALLVWNTFAIGLAGLLGLRHGIQALGRRIPSRKLALGISCGWLAGNITLGSQLAWNLRPFFATPSTDVAFLRPNPFDGSFFESFLKSTWRLVTGA
ncbi:MAG: hypothetical protein AAF581_14865 [Planctomycetota bacterium]